MREQDGLERLWEAYRQATPEPEVSVNFTPKLWARIDAARPTTWAVPVSRWAARFLPWAAAVTLALGVWVWNPSGGDTTQSGYVELLAADLMEESQI